jgi:hypothetical protein
MKLEQDFKNNRFALVFEEHEKKIISEKGAIVFTEEGIKKTADILVHALISVKLSLSNSDVPTESFFTDEMKFSSEKWEDINKK